MCKDKENEKNKIISPRKIKQTQNKIRKGVGKPFYKRKQLPLSTRIK